MKTSDKHSLTLYFKNEAQYRQLFRLVLATRCLPLMGDDLNEARPESASELLELVKQADGFSTSHPAN